MSQEVTLISSAIHKALEARIAEIVNAEADAAAKRVAERVRGETARIAAEVMSWQRMEFRQNEVVITIRIPDKCSS